MSIREAKRRKIAGTVMREAWKLRRQTTVFTYGISIALRICWKIVRSKARFIHSKVRGTSFGNRQLLLKRLNLYDSRDIVMNLIREPNNPADPSAIQIWVYVIGKGSGCIGYVSKEIAYELAVLMDSGRSVVALFDCVTGGGNKHYGCNYRFLPV